MSSIGIVCHSLHSFTEIAHCFQELASWLELVLIISCHSFSPMCARLMCTSSSSSDVYISSICCGSCSPYRRHTVCLSACFPVSVVRAHSTVLKCLVRKPHLLLSLSSTCEVICLMRESESTDRFLSFHRIYLSLSLVFIQQK